MAGNERVTSECLHLCVVKEKLIYTSMFLSESWNERECVRAHVGGSPSRVMLYVYLSAIPSFNFITTLSYGLLNLICFRIGQCFIYTVYIYI